MTAEQLAADEALIHSDFPLETVWIGTATFSALVGHYWREVKLDLGGFRPDYDLQLVISRSQFAGITRPKGGDRAVFRNEVFAVNRVTEHDGQASILIELTYQHQRNPENVLQAADGTWLLSEDGKPLEP